MALRNTFGPLTTAQMQQLDQNFADVGADVVIPCTASGTNTITLNPNIGNSPAISAYANYQRFGFVAINNSTGPVSILVVGTGGNLATLPLFYPDGVTRVSVSGILANCYYDVVFNTALNGGGNGFQLVGNQLPGGLVVAASNTGAGQTLTLTVSSGANSAYYGGFPNGLVDGMRFRFIGQQSTLSSSGFIPSSPIFITVTNISGTGAGPHSVYAGDATTVFGIQDITQNQVYEATFVSSLSGNNGGFVVVSNFQSPTQQLMRHGQVRLTAATTFTSNVTLQGYNGGGLLVKDPTIGNWRMLSMGGGLSADINSCITDAGGVAQTLASNQLWYCYVQLMSGLGSLPLQPSLIFSKTGHGTDPALGIEVQNGTSTNNSLRTYVGLLYPLGVNGNGITQFSGQSQALVASWFNRQNLILQTPQVVAQTGSQAHTELATSLRLNTVFHADQVPFFAANGYATCTAVNSNNGHHSNMQLFLTGTLSNGALAQTGGTISKAGHLMLSGNSNQTPDSGNPGNHITVFGQNFNEGYVQAQVHGSIDVPGDIAQYFVYNTASVWI